MPLNGLVAKFVKSYVTEDNIWDKEKLQAVEGVSGRCIMEEVKTYHCNLVLVFYDYKGGYDKGQHDWMLWVCTWMDIPENVTALLSKLMRKKKTKIEIWNDGETKCMVS